MLYFNYLFIKLLILYLYTTVNYCVEFTVFFATLYLPRDAKSVEAQKHLSVSITRFPFKAQS